MTTTNPNFKPALDAPEAVLHPQKIKCFLPIIGDGVVAGFFFVTQSVLGVGGREVE